MRKKLVEKKDVPLKCKNCVHSRPLGEGDMVFCEKTGIRSSDALCKSFRYDPLNRVPRRSPNQMEFSKEDFEL